jgi:phosphocarrier protein
MILNKKGLHASASGKFSKVAGAYKAVVRVANESGSVAGDSIMDLLMLGAAMGTEITITAEGPEAREALDSLVKLVAAKFGEKD